LIAGNYRSVFTVDMRTKPSHILSSKVSDEDGSTNRLSCVRRLKEFNHFVLADEDKVLIYDLRNMRKPVHSVDHYLHDAIEFNDIVLPAFSADTPLLESFGELETLKQPSKLISFKNQTCLLISTKNPSHLLQVETFVPESRRDLVISDLGKLSGWDTNLIMHGLKPTLVQSSPMYNNVSNLRGC
jgi:hypothetical protein